jgi:hypothetical protein
MAAALALAGLACSGACTRRASQPAWTFDEHVGIVSAPGDASCLSIRADVGGTKTPLRVIDPGAGRSYTASIGSASEACLLGHASSDGWRGYAIQFDGAAPPTPMYAIGVVGGSSEVRSANGAMTADLDGDGRNEVFRACTSAEGLHLTIWTDAALTGVRRWHAYQALGYDVSPTCAPADFAP